jgi:alpha-L-fucosidase
MVEAFRQEGLKVGFYYSLIDWHHPDFTVDRHHPMRNNDKERSRNSQRDMKRYTRYMRDQVRELLTGFGPIDIMWFDFSYPGEDGKGRDDWESRKLYDLVRELQPNVIIDNRLDLPDAGDFVTPEQFQPAAGLTDSKGNPVVWEACQTFSGSWGYHRDETTWKNVGQLLRMLIDGVSKGGNLLLNVGPTGRGEFDSRALDRLRGMGEWMRRNGRSIYGCGTAPGDLQAPTDCRYTYNPQTNRLYLHVFAWPFKTIYCPGLADRIEYAQFLHDASEVRIGEVEEAAWSGMSSTVNPLAIHVPVVKPNVEVPVIELFLR